MRAAALGMAPEHHPAWPVHPALYARLHSDMQKRELMEELSVINATNRVCISSSWLR